jgi:YbbR domain-containing protein
MKLKPDNIGWRLFSVGAAVVLWITFVGSPELVRSVSAPIEFRRMPQELEISSEVPDNVYLEVRGPSARLHSVDLSGTTVVLDLGGVNRSGEHTFTITPANIDLQPGLDVVRAVPAQIRLNFERRITADVPVRVRLASSPPPGYRVVRQEVRPATLGIVGPESHVREVEHVETDPIDVSDAVGKREFRVGAFVRDQYVRLRSSAPVTVTVTLERE